MLTLDNPRRGYRPYNRYEDYSELSHMISHCESKKHIQIIRALWVNGQISKEERTTEENHHSRLIQHSKRKFYSQNVEQENRSVCISKTSHRMKAIITSYMVHIVHIVHKVWE
jgi:hypothetical protein